MFTTGEYASRKLIGQDMVHLLNSACLPSLPLQQGLPFHIPAIADHGIVAHPRAIPEKLPLLAAYPYGDVSVRIAISPLIVPSRYIGHLSPLLRYPVFLDFPQVPGILSQPFDFGPETSAHISTDSKLPAAAGS